MTDRPAITDQQPAVYGATQPARLVITETVAASRTQGDGPWTTAEAILGALERAGYTVAPRASEAVRGDGSPTPDVGAVRGGEGGSAAESEPLPMRPEDVPSEWIWIAREAHRTAPQKRDGKPTRMRHAIAAVAPLIRAQAIADAYNEVTKLHDASTYQDGYGWFERAAYANVLDALTRIARGDQ